MILMDSSVCGLFKWHQFGPEVILLAIGWYLRFSLSYRDVEELLAERGLSVDERLVAGGAAVAIDAEFPGRNVGPTSRR
jgi:transposase-like protein